MAAAVNQGARCVGVRATYIAVPHEHGCVEPDRIREPAGIRIQPSQSQDTAAKAPAARCSS
jgi:hypothetical protein